jgi:hypothetical protein
MAEEVLRRTHFRTLTAAALAPLEIVERPHLELSFFPKINPAIDIS